MKRIFKDFINMKSILSLLLVLSPFISKADAASAAPHSTGMFSIIILVILVLITFVLLYILFTLKVFLDHAKPNASAEPVMAGFLKKLTDTVPLDQEESILTDHVYDDIRELDNNLPPWWKYMFYATIVFSFAYIYYYHFNENGQLQIEEYTQELAVAEKEKEAYMKLAANSIDETNVKLADLKGIEKGKGLYQQNCAACHGSLGEGGVGPNLTDPYWLHGGGVKNVFKSIKYGIPQKGMISWKAQLSPSAIQEVASYIISIQGSNPTNAKSPQGDKYEGED
ncbi:cbb3-type cytochrome c oxidase N-terminal domain-containing protein [Sporocytophaga myxococcoides]|nr:cbb3-type cytochrome c oxidase N-terminal domain-containing protein [Sporocytophaga myxococcoides]